MRFNMHRRWVDQFISLMNSGSIRSLNLYRRCLYNFGASVGNVNSERDCLSRLPTSHRVRKTVVPTHVLRVYWVNYWEAAIALLESVNWEKPDLSSGFYISSYFPRAVDFWYVLVFLCFSHWKLAKTGAFQVAFSVLFGTHCAGRMESSCETPLLSCQIYVQYVICYTVDPKW
jgi:hypothetical protein